jgi:hypothetical protein
VSTLDAVRIQATAQVQAVQVQGSDPGSKNEYRGANSGQEWKCCGSAEGWPQLYQYKELSKDAANQQSMQQTTLARLCMRTEEVEGS